MISSYAKNAYLNAAVKQDQEPKKLIMMLYEGAIKHIHLTKMGIKESNACKRGENLSRSVAIISALHASLDESVNDESISFLRSLYEKMLVELARVAVSHDVKPLDLTLRYLERLKGIWEQQVMNGKLPSQVLETQEAVDSVIPGPQPPSPKAPYGYGPSMQTAGRTISV